MENKNTREILITKTETVTRLNTLFHRGFIRDWVWNDGEDYHTVILNTGTAVLLTAREIKIFHLGILAAKSK